MINGKRVLAIIPARGGSKGLPGKNIRPLNGRPLIAWPITTALNSQYIDRVVVSTDDSDIASIALKYGADVPFMRPKEFAQDSSPSSQAIIHAITFCNEADGGYDYIVLLEPTSPLTESIDIDKALESLVQSKGLAIVGASKVDASHPAYCTIIGEDGFLRPYNRDSFLKPIRRQELDDLYFFEGTLYISDINHYLKTETFYHDRTLPYIVPSWKAIEIDTLLDFLKVETILNNKELLTDFN